MSGEVLKKWLNRLHVCQKLKIKVPHVGQTTTTNYQLPKSEFSLDLSSAWTSLPLPSTTTKYQLVLVGTQLGPQLELKIYAILPLPTTKLPHTNYRNSALTSAGAQNLRKVNNKSLKISTQSLKINAKSLTNH